MTAGGKVPADGRRRAGAPRVGGMVAGALSAIGLSVSPVPAEAAGALAAVPGWAELWQTTITAVDFALDWLGEGYAHAPAVVIGLAALVLLPPLSLIGLLLGLLRPARPRTAPAAGPAIDEPVHAWVEVVSAGGERHEIGHGMVVIGRADDIDIRLAGDGVQGYHAAIHATPESGYVLTDLGGTAGNGVAVNGRRVAGSPLRDGDRIAIGTAELAFHAVSQAYIPDTRTRPTAAT